MDLLIVYTFNYWCQQVRSIAASCRSPCLAQESGSYRFAAENEATHARQHNGVPFMQDETGAPCRIASTAWPEKSISLARKMPYDSCLMPKTKPAVRTATTTNDNDPSN